MVGLIYNIQKKRKGQKENEMREKERWRCQSEDNERK